MSDISTPQSSIAVFIDYENLALGTGKRKKNGHQEPGHLPEMKLIMERLVDKGRITAKRAYCDWQRFPNAITPLHELGIELIEIPDRAYTGKNSADIRLAVDAVEMCLTKDHIDTFAVLSGVSLSASAALPTEKSLQTAIENTKKLEQTEENKKKKAIYWGKERRKQP